MQCPPSLQQSEVVSVQTCHPISIPYNVIILLLQPISITCILKLAPAWCNNFRQSILPQSAAKCAGVCPAYHVHGVISYQCILIRTHH